MHLTVVTDEAGPHAEGDRDERWDMCLVCASHDDLPVGPVQRRAFELLPHQEDPSLSSLVSTRSRAERP